VIMSVKTKRGNRGSASVPASRGLLRATPLQLLLESSRLMYLGRTRGQLSYLPKMTTATTEAAKAIKTGGVAKDWRVRAAILTDEV